MRAHAFRKAIRHPELVEGSDSCRTSDSSTINKSLSYQKGYSRLPSPPTTKIDTLADWVYLGSTSMAEIQKTPTTVGNAEMAQRFVQFVMMQAQNIYYVLGKIPSPDGRPIPPNLEAAKLLIDQLEMVQEKTRNNLSTQETSILEDALKNVRLGFVEASGGTPASMMPKSQLGEFPMDEDYDQDSLDDAKSAPLPSAPDSGGAAPASTPTPVESESKKKFTKSYG
jgi:hypothetical protein